MPEHWSNAVTDIITTFQNAPTSSSQVKSLSRRAVVVVLWHLFKLVIYQKEANPTSDLINALIEDVQYLSSLILGTRKKKSHFPGGKQFWQEKLKKNSGLNRIQTHDFCDTDAVFLPLSFCNCIICTYINHCEDPSCVKSFLCSSIC